MAFVVCSRPRVYSEAFCPVRPGALGSAGYWMSMQSASLWTVTGYRLPWSWVLGYSHHSWLPSLGSWVIPPLHSSLISSGLLSPYPLQELFSSGHRDRILYTQPLKRGRLTVESVMAGKARQEQPVAAVVEA